MYPRILAVILFLAFVGAGCSKNVTNFSDEENQLQGSWKQLYIADSAATTVFFKKDTFGTINKSYVSNNYLFRVDINRQKVRCVVLIYMGSGPSALTYVPYSISVDTLRLYSLDKSSATLYQKVK